MLKWEINEWRRSNFSIRHNMALAFLNNFLCCCHPKRQDEEDLFDDHNAESSRLIPNNLEPTM